MEWVIVSLPTGSYLKEIEADVKSVEQLADKKALVEKIIDRSMHHVSS